MPQKLNKAGKMQDYIPKGNGDASGEYGTSNGTNKNFTTSDKKKTEANVITENKSVVVGDKEWLKNKIDETAKKKAELDEKNSTRNVYGTEEERDREGAKKLGVSLEEYKKLKEQHKKEMADIFEDKETKKDFSNSRELREYYDEKYEEIRDKYAIEKDKIKRAEYEKQMDKIQEERKEAYSKLKENGKEVIYDGKKEIKANIIDNDLTGKKEEIKESFEFNDRKGTNETKKMVEAMFELGINPVKDWDKQQYKKAEQLADYFLEKGLGKPSEKMMKGRNGTQRDVLIGTFLDLQDALRMKFTNKSFSKWFDETQAKYNK